MLVVTSFRQPNSFCDVFKDIIIVIIMLDVVWDTPTELLEYELQRLQYFFVIVFVRMRAPVSTFAVGRMRMCQVSDDRGLMISLSYLRLFGIGLLAKTKR